MSGIFYGLEIAKTGLFTAQRALQVIGHNVANVNTQGYTRQRIITQAIDAAAPSARYLPPLSTGKVGGGVQVALLDQVRSDYIDREIRRENSDLGLWNARALSIGYIESLFDVNKAGSLSAALSDFFDSLSDLSTDPVSKELRTALQQSGLKLTETFNHFHTQLRELQLEQNDSIKITVDEINDMLTSITELNRQIYAYELGGSKANDLRDKRNLLIDELSQKIDISCYEDTEGRLVIENQGKEIVHHLDMIPLGLVASGEIDGTTIYDVHYIEGPGLTTPFAFGSGELAAYKNMRDGDSVDNMGIPYILDQLDTLARALAREFNAIHSTGYTQAREGQPSQTGINLFAVPAGGYDAITAGNFSLSAEVLADVYNIAASDTLVDLSAANTQQGNNVKVLEMLELTTSASIEGVGSFENFLKSIVAQIGIQSRHCQNMGSSQATIVENLLNRRESISGVSIDEEMAQMVRCQHAYAASARMFNAIDEQLDILINRTGMVGR